MITIERILCAVDQSVYSPRTVRRALVLGRRVRAKVIVMTVNTGVAPSVWEPGRAGSAAGSDSAAAQRLFEFAADAAGIAPSKAVVVNGSVVPEVLGVAESEAADLLGVGLHGPPSGFFERTSAWEAGELAETYPSGL